MAVPREATTGGILRRLARTAAFRSRGARIAALVRSKACTSGLLAVIASSATACGGSRIISEQTQRDHRLEFELFARTDVYVGAVTQVGPCSVGLEPAEAYPGIAAEAEWIDIFAWQFVRISHSAAGSDIGSTIFVHDRDLAGIEALDALWALVPYDGPTAPALDAEITCDDVDVRGGSVRRVAYMVPVTSIEPGYGVSVDSAVAMIEDLRGDEPRFVATQESFLTPDDVADAVVGETSWPPPSRSAYVRDRTQPP